MEKTRKGLKKVAARAVGVFEAFVMLGSFTSLEFQPQIAVKHTTRSQRETKQDSLLWQVLYK